MNAYKTRITDTVLGISINDTDIDLFESQYPVPGGVSYNSYLIRDEKTAVLDTVDARATDAWLAALEEELAGAAPDYLVVSHVEPDHSANVARLAEKYPAMQVVGNAKTFAYLENFFPGAIAPARRVTVKEGDTLALGSHTLHFVFAPMVHWPEVMVSYEDSEKLLFSADGFGRFGVVADGDSFANWADDARRYYLNIVGKYGPQVQALLKKAAGLDIARICPLHGPVLDSEIGYYIGKYQTWSSYNPEQKGVLIACASIYGNTAAAAQQLAEMLRERGEQQVRVMDLARCDIAEAVAEAFRYDTTVLASSTYDAGILPAMEIFLCRLKSKNWQRRTVGIIENGSWAPAAARAICERVGQMKCINVVEPIVTIRSTLNAESRASLERLADALKA